MKGATYLNIWLQFDTAVRFFFFFSFLNLSSKFLSELNFVPDSVTVTSHQTLPVFSTYSVRHVTVEKVLTEYFQRYRSSRQMERRAIFWTWRVITPTVWYVWAKPESKRPETGTMCKTRKTSSNDWSSWIDVLRTSKVLLSAHRQTSPLCVNTTQLYKGCYHMGLGTFAHCCLQQLTAFCVFSVWKIVFKKARKHKHTAKTCTVQDTGWNPRIPPKKVSVPPRSSSEMSESQISLSLEALRNILFISSVTLQLTWQTWGSCFWHLIQEALHIKPRKYHVRLVS